MIKKPRLRTVLFLVNMVILAMPLFGIAALRLYESELIRRTEAQLNAQGAAIAAAMAQEYEDYFSKFITGGAFAWEAVGKPAPKDVLDRLNDGEPFHPILPDLDLAEDKVYGPAPKAAPGHAMDAAAKAVGEKLLPVILATKDITLAGIRVVDHRGVVIASSGDAGENGVRYEYGMSLAAWPEVKSALRGIPHALIRKRQSDNFRPKWNSVSRRKRVRVFTALPVIYKGRILGAVLLSRTPMDVMKTLYKNRFHIVDAGIMIIFVVVLVSIFTALTISRPVGQLIEQARRASRGERGAMTPLARPGTYEVAQLSGELSKMAAELEERADYIRDFAARVSHEFKTPLTAIAGAVELLRDHKGDMTPEENERFLSIIGDDVSRLDRLVKRLLELARADVIQPGEEKINAGDMLEGIAAQYAQAGMKIPFTKSEDELPLRISAENFQSIIRNLLDNARLYGGEDVTVAIEARRTAGASGPAAEITIADDGPGVSAANAVKIFDPFFTTARESGGSGLGLSIARSLLSAYGGTITLADSEKGCRFVVTIPL